MKLGSRSFYAFMRRIYWFNIAYLTIGIPLLFCDVLKVDLPVNYSIFLTPGILIVSIFHFIAAFEPIHERNQWEKVYPQLKD
ncbi:MAG: GldL-related protein [Flavobacteriales bacterium]